MTRALVWIRKSKGSDDDIGLSIQRETLPELAEDIADKYDVIDLGVQTGFSTLTRDDETGLIDQRDDVQEIVETIRSGNYDHLIAWDDRRVCRDGYFSVIEHACIQGDCELVFESDDVQRDDLSFRIHRTVERHTKDEEIRKARAAIKRRQEDGCYQGTIPFGLRLGRNKCYLERDPEEWPVVEEIIDRRMNGVSVTQISEGTGVSRSSVSRIANRGIEWFEDKLQEYGAPEVVADGSGK